jgi:hypothetical protein|tara:strand:- start:10018 stop:10242 length:225 start_codon:yes stop_codon:yes gene_type:complete
MDSIKEAASAPLKEPRNESELLLNQVAEEKEEKDTFNLINLSTDLSDATDYHAAWGFESDDDYDLFLFGVGGPA